MSTLLGATKPAGRFDFRSSAPLIMLVAIVLVASICLPGFRTFGNAMNVARQASMIGLVSIGMGFVILSGGIDLSVGSTTAVAALLAAYLSNFSPVAAIAVPILAGITIGAINGGLITRMRIPPFIATLATMSALRGLAFLITPIMATSLQAPAETSAQPAAQSQIQIESHSEETKGTITTVSDGWFRNLNWGKIAGIPYFVLIFAFTLIAAIIVSMLTSFGRAVYAVGGNEEAARMMGLRVDRCKMIVYMIGGACAGAAGVLFAARIGSVRPDIGAGWELEAIAAVVISGIALTGGIGRIGHIVYGVLILGFIPNIINLMDFSVSTYTNQLITGILLLAAVLLQAKIARSNSAGG